MSTELIRAPLAQELRCVLDAATYFRKVQILVPSSPDIYADVFNLDGSKLVIPDDPETAVITPDQAVAWFGHNRGYKLAQIYPGAAVAFRLFPNQIIVAQSGFGTTTITLVVQPTHAPRP